MNIFDAYVFFAAIFGFLIFLLYLALDYARSNQNAFWDKWVKKTLWLWLPFYGLRRLLREVVFKVKK